MRHLKTKRLYFRDYRPEDRRPLIRIMNDIDVMQYFPESPTIDDIDEFLQETKISILDRGFGLFAVERRSKKEFIGVAGIRVKQYDEVLRLDDIEHLFPCIEIFIILDKKYWNQGLATEALNGVLKFTRKKTDIKDVYAFVSKMNLPALNVMDKIGMRPVYEYIDTHFFSGHRKAPSLMYKINVE